MGVVSLSEGTSEVKTLKEHIKDSEYKINHLEQQLRDTTLQRDEAKLEMERLNEGIRQSRSSHEDCLRQQRQREEELQDLIRTMDEREIEYQETRKVKSFEPLHKKTFLRGFRPVQTQTGLYNRRKWLEDGNLIFRK